MKYIGDVYGTAEQARALVIGLDTVYVHTDTEELENGLYKYKEAQYGKDEYIELMAAQNAQLGTELADTQIALCEIYESNGGAK